MRHPKKKIDGSTKVVRRRALARAKWMALDHNIREAIEARRERERLFRAIGRKTQKREQLKAAVIAQAMAMWRWQLTWRPAGGGAQTASLFDARPLARACAALAKFEAPTTFVKPRTGAWGLPP